MAKRLLRAEDLVKLLDLASCEEIGNWGWEMTTKAGVVIEVTPEVSGYDWHWVAFCVEEKAS